MTDATAAATALAELHRRTLQFAVSVAAQLEYPKNRCHGGISLGEGYYYEIDGLDLKDQDVKKIQERTEELIKAGDVIKPVTKSWKEAMTYFDENGLVCAKALLETRVSSDVHLYECRDVLRLALTPLHPSTGSLAAGKFALIPSAPGFIASYADSEYAPQPALMSSQKDHMAFGKSQGIECVGKLNTLRQVGRGRKDFVLHCEFRQESKLADIASKVESSKASGKPIKVICIAGPTSSGKTTFANKLCMYLKNKSCEAVPLTVDHYYLPLNEQPKYKIRQQRSDVDYDSIESMDVELVGKHLNALIAGEDVMTPQYNMKTGYRDEPGNFFKGLSESGILVIEGIHALNPLYTEKVERSKVFKVFISPLSVLQIDDCNTVKTTTHRLLRRMCRDYLFRGHSASKTLSMWDNVRKGEGVWIFPHQNNADFVMNSAAEYEICVLKTVVEPLLREVPADDPKYKLCEEVLKFLDHFASWPTELAPSTALLREFIGEGAFDCH